MTSTDRTEGSDDLERMPLMDHLVELRSRIIKTVMAVAAGAVVGWILYPWILEFLVAPYQGICDVVGDPGSEATQDAIESNPECQLLVTDPLEGFNVRLTVAAYTGIALAMPVLLWQLWRFVSPGLYAKERKYGAIFVLCGVALFAMGASLAFWSLPRALDFLDSIGGENLMSFFSPDRYISFVIKMMLAFGIGFEFPIVLIFMQIAGLLDNETLRSGRQYALVGIVVMVAVITPSGDPFTLMVLSVPMYIFYEVAILFGRLRNRRLDPAS